MFLMTLCRPKTANPCIPCHVELQPYENIEISALVLIVLKPQNRRTDRRMYNKIDVFPIQKLKNYPKTLSIYPKSC